MLVLYLVLASETWRKYCSAPSVGNVVADEERPGYWLGWATNSSLP